MLRGVDAQRSCHAFILGLFGNGKLMTFVFFQALGIAVHVVNFCQ
jgi:hypothetical protein